MSYTNLLYHIVYATKERAPLITKTLRPRLHEYLGGTVRGLGGIALVGKHDSAPSPSASRKSSACDVTFVTRNSIIESFRSRKSSSRCYARTTLILMQLICGDELCRQLRRLRCFFPSVSP